MSPTPWHVEEGFAVASIVAADGTVVAQNLTPEDARAIVAAMRVVEAARKREEEIYAALAAYDEATR